ncbi:MAG: transketolase [Desulfomonile tiedjei]|nr:transketolase [Desulfomonile tiedjei]
MNSSVNLSELEFMAKRIRGRVVEMSHKARAPHLGSSLSCVDILVAVYWAAMSIDPANPCDVNRDRCILSKGHAASALYAALAFRGFFPEDYLDSYVQSGGSLAEHPLPRCAPGVEAATGSLGHGLSIGLGMALAGRIQKANYRVFVVMSDGECNEGSVWEAALLAAARGADNVIAIIDYNKWQATGRSEEVMALRPLKQKWEAFGWSAYELDGHDLHALVNTLDKLPDGTGKPAVVIAHTVKGKGVSFMEDDNNWHYRIPSADEVGKAKRELGLS